MMKYVEAGGNGTGGFEVVKEGYICNLWMGVTGKAPEILLQDSIEGVIKPIKVRMSYRRW